MTPRARLPFIVLLLALIAAPATARAEPGALLGIYPQTGLSFPGAVDTITDIDTWLVPTGRRISIAGTFMDMEAPSYIPGELNAAWNRGYVAFVNLALWHPAAAINAGNFDTAIHAWAHQYAIWTNGGQKRAFLALLQEMNGYWTPYSGNPAAYIAAFRRIRQIFEQELAAAGVPSRAISWVFAPNGWSQPGTGNEFENYYPGGDVVDVVSFSGYNFGHCGFTWDTYDVSLGQYLDRMRAMAPTKPIFIAETAVVDAPVNGVGDKNQWLYDTYTKLAAYPGLRGVVYFNRTDTFQVGCAITDWRIHVPGTSLWPGFWNAVKDTPKYVYWAPDSPEMRDIAFGRAPAQIFADVPTIHPFAVEDGQSDLSPWIHALFNAGITGGCGTSPLRYCPGNAVTRAQMAKFLMLGIHGAGYSPPAPTGTRFDDVPIDLPLADWIEAFADAGITSGCGTRLYCPGAVVTRAQMAKFLLLAKNGPGYTPPPADGDFSDVPLDQLAPWIEALAASGITGGCGSAPLRFCPGNAVTRAQMAIFLVRTFGLPM